tara:strand:- start:246 stop:1586 length:1341 start_codon:yes stop_codon:yes gene_type:complete
MSDLQDLLKKLNAGPVSTMSYVYYDKENGKIHKISSANTPQEGFEVFEIENSEVNPILTGERRTDEFTITYDVSLKQVRLKEVAYDDSHNTAATMCYQLPVIKDTNNGHFSVTSIFEGIDICIWDITKSYNLGQFVWHNNLVYKLKTNIEQNVEFDTTAHSVFVDNVVITTMPTQSQTIINYTMNPEYQGVHVDVWYKELSHLAGQHVWLNGNVYKISEDAAADTEFTMDNATVIIGNVLLYADENKLLKTINNINPGDIILKYNSIYSIQEEEEKFDKDKSSIFFYNSLSTLLYYNNKNCLEIDLTRETGSVDSNDMRLMLSETTDLKNGQTILCGKSLYQIAVDKEYDIIVQQNTLSKSWSLSLNPYTKKFLQTSGYSPVETLYFSVTSKYDPNVLYRSLEFTVADLLDAKTSVIPFNSEAEADPLNVSIYTAKYFDSYAHEVI